MMYLFIAAIAFIAGHYVASYQWVANAKDYRRREFGGNLYKVLADDDPLFDITSDVVDRLQFSRLVKDHER